MHAPTLIDQAERNSRPNTLTPVYPLRWVPSGPRGFLVRHSEWIDALGRKVFLDSGSRQPKVPSGLIDLKRSWDESDLDADEFCEWVSSFTVSEDAVDWCDDCGYPVFYPFIADGGAREVCRSCLDDNYTKCDNCNDAYPDLTSVGDQKVCEYCLQDYYETCDESEEPVRDTEVVDDGTGYECVFDNCHDYFDCYYSEYY